MDDIYCRKAELTRSLQVQEQEKLKSQHELETVKDQLQKIEKSIVTKVDAIGGFDKTLAEAESAYMKILESSQTLLSVVKKENSQLNERAHNSMTVSNPNLVYHHSTSFGGMGEGRHNM